jgi:uncharacterized protein YbjT (DUF2867 family)
MKMVIPGGTGQVGRILCRAFSSAGDEAVVLTRKANPGCPPSAIVLLTPGFSPVCD